MRAVLASPLGERFDMRVVNSSPSDRAGVHGTSRLRVDRVLDALRVLGRLLIELVRFRPAVVHVNTSYYWAFLRDALCVWLARAFGARTLLHLRGGDFPDFVNGAPAPLHALIAASLRRADRLVALTEPTRTYLEAQVGAQRVRYLPNFVRLEDLGEPPDRGSRPRRPVRVLFVGWLLEAKGVRELLAAARSLPEAQFTLVGPEDRTFLEAIRPELEVLGERVRLLPARPRSEIFALYREADIFVLPTWREGFPNVVLEAMGAGLPVVATPVGAIPEAARDGREAILVPARDADALCRALRRLIDDPDLRVEMGRRARARAEAQYSFEAIVGRLDSLYRELLAERVD